MTFEIEKKIPMTDEDKDYLIKIITALFEEYEKTLNDSDTSYLKKDLYVTDRDMFVEVGFDFIDWLHDNIEPPKSQLDKEEEAGLHQ